MLKMHPMTSGKAAVLLALLACACGAKAPSSASAGGASGGVAGSPGTSAAGSATAGGPGVGTRFAGSYEVPVDPALAAAAVFPLAELEWTVNGSDARLAYSLPPELVGKELRVDFSGTLAADNTAQLTGEAGTADCAIAATEVVCQEQMPGLLPLEPDLAVVEKLAQASYAGNAADRVAVAQLFGADPIGIARVHLAEPVENGAKPERD
jgi:hypothetical protein